MGSDYSVVIEKRSYRELQSESCQLWNEWNNLPAWSSPDWFVDPNVIRTIIEVRPPEAYCWLSRLLDNHGQTIGVMILTCHWKRLLAFFPVRRGVMLRSGSMSQDQWWPEYVQPRCHERGRHKIGWWLEETQRKLRLFSLEIEVSPLDWIRRWHANSCQSSVLVEYLSSAFQRTLSQNMDWDATTRRYCRQTARYSESQLGGELVLFEAEPAERLSYVKKYSHWHKNKWRHTETPSGFDNPVFVKQWESLLSQDGAAVRVFIACAGDRVVGITVILDDGYWCGFYLSSLMPEPSNHWHLGMWMHVRIMEKLSAQGRGVYDFMAGDASYKKRLSNESTEHAKATWFMKKSWLASLFLALKKHIFSCNIIKHKNIRG